MAEYGYRPVRYTMLTLHKAVDLARPLWRLMSVYTVYSGGCQKRTSASAGLQDENPTIPYGLKQRGRQQF